MKWLYLCFLIIMTGVQSVCGQHIELQFQLLDEETANPISDAHVFISSSSIGTISDAQGKCAMTVAAQETQSLIISHISYESLVIAPERFPSLADGASVKMKSNGFNISEIEITAKRSGKWKKNFRKFKHALLGDGIAAKNCTILNPEVVRFEEQNGKLTASAMDQLQIDNDYLGYQIQFLLDELSIEADGSRYYKGNGQFTDQPGLSEAQKLRRAQIYQNSLAHFLSSLILSPDKATLKERGYQVSIEQFNQGEFSTIAVPEPKDLIKADSKPARYQLHFAGFLTIQHQNVIESPNSGYQVDISSAEQQKFGAAPSVSMRSDEQFALSRLYKIKPHLVFDIRGNIINKSAVREYNYWADQRLATTLPIDYKSFSDFEPERPASDAIDTLEIFKQLVGADQLKREQSQKVLQMNWSDGYIAPLLDILRLSRDPWHQQEVQALLREHVPQMKPDYFQGSQWLWQKDPNYGSYYADFKAHLYSALDPRFNRYFFERGEQSKIRLDEIVWGGVRQDGIPPLRSPKMISATEAVYLSDTDVVFGLVIDGAAYAYPKRILAWHEFFTDDIGGLSIAGVYCTLCGTVIIYNSEFNGVKHDLGTSGFLYRSNKLMYDRATQSLWSTIEGGPVVGPLVDQNIELSTLPVATTTWGAWRSKHPETKVLSLETGHARNYVEGEAYKDYYAVDDLMFPVPMQDNRLANKARVFIPRTDNYKQDPLAISVDYLKRKGIHQDQIVDQRILIISERNGASRAYAIDDHQFKSYKQRNLVDNQKQEWKVTESVLIGPNGQRLSRLPAHEVFWFAWVNIFPDTRIVY
ncbi:MAG: DUF3179 domain-containing protein [Bacteroidia bacterium]|nr:DUF3179 domain-containing protein [Bacteroidia bacterium]